MGDGYTELNPGQGGNFLDETTVAFGSAPLERRRERVHIGGHLAEHLAEVYNTSPANTDYGLVVRPIMDGQKLTVGLELPGDPVSVFGSVTLVAANLETTVSTYTIPVSKTFHAIGWVGGGSMTGCYRFYINNVLQMVARTSVAQPTVEMSFQLASPTGSAGQVVKVTAQHDGKNARGLTIMADFESTILGYNT